MSIPQIRNTDNFENISLPPLSPITKKSESIVSENFFDKGALQGGLGKYNDLATRAQKLGDLQTELKAINKKKCELEVAMNPSTRSNKLATMLKIAAVVSVTFAVVISFTVMVTTFWWLQLALSGPAGLPLALTALLCAETSIVGLILTSTICTIAVPIVEGCSPPNNTKLINDKNERIKFIQDAITDVVEQHKNPSSSDKKTFNALMSKIDQRIAKLNEGDPEWEEITDKKIPQKNLDLIQDLETAKREAIALKEQVDAVF